MTNVKNEWFEKQWLVYLLCLVFFPVGLYGLWKNQSISKGLKIAITVVITLVLLTQINTNSSVEKNSTSEVGSEIVSNNNSESDKQSDNFISPTDINIEKDSFLGKEVFIKGYFKSLGEWKYLYDEAGSSNFVQLNIDSLPKEIKKNLLTECSDGCDKKFKAIVEKVPYTDIIMLRLLEQL
jgi:hypothetical protein